MHLCLCRTHRCSHARVCTLRVRARTRATCYTCCATPRACCATRPAASPLPSWARWGWRAGRSSCCGWAPACSPAAAAAAAARWTARWTAWPRWWRITHTRCGTRSSMSAPCRASAFCLARMHARMLLCLPLHANAPLLPLRRPPARCWPRPPDGRACRRRQLGRRARARQRPARAAAAGAAGLRRRRHAAPRAAHSQRHVWPDAGRLCGGARAVHRGARAHCGRACALRCGRCARVCVLQQRL